MSRVVWSSEHNVSWIRTGKLLFAVACFGSMTAVGREKTSKFSKAECLIRPIQRYGAIVEMLVGFGNIIVQCFVSICFTGNLNHIALYNT